MGDQRLSGTGLVLIGVLSVQLGSATATTLFDEIGPGGTVFLRTVFAAALLVAIWRPGREVLRGTAGRDVVLFGVVLAGMNASFFAALERLPLGIAVTLEFTGPLAVAIAGSRRSLDLAWVALAATGIVLLAPGFGDGLDPVGIGYALLAGAFWGTYLLVASRVGRGPDGRRGLAAAMLVATALLLPLGIGEGGGELLDGRLLAVGAAVAMLSSAIPYLVEMEALRRLAAGTVGILFSLEPATAALIGLIALDQGLLAREVLAIACVTAASAGALSTAPTIEPTQA